MFNQRDIEKYITILKQAAKDFKKRPKVSLHNDSGLCLYLKEGKGLSVYDVRYILQDMYSGWQYTIDEYGQDYLYKKKKTFNLTFRYRFNKRSKWCKQRIKELEKELRILKQKPIL